MLRTVLTASAVIAFTVGTAAAQGAFETLPPGNQKIAQALCAAQPGGCTPSSLDNIAAMKQHRGWGEIFKEMQKNEQIPPDVKNLGQLVRGQNHPPSRTFSGTTITSASGKSQVVGKPEHANKSGKGHRDDDSVMDARGANADRASDVSGQGRGYASGQGFGSGAGIGRSGFGGHGGGRGK